MPRDQIRYQALVEDALRGVVREILSRVASDGLPGGHHFYISFRTDDPSAMLSNTLRARYPEEMTVVLQHQFWDLDIQDEGFSVTLSFNKMPEVIYVPYHAMTGFFDPSVQFGLQFGAEGKDGGEAGAPDGIGKVAAPHSLPEAASQDGEATETAETAAQADDKDDEANVVTLDQFRKR